MTMKHIRLALIIIESAVCLAAVIGGIGLITTSLKVPATLLEGSPFNSYFIPAMILTVIVGGTNALAVYSLITRHKIEVETSATAGFGLVIWIFTQTYLLGGLSWIQPLFFIVGIAILILTMVLLKFEKPKPLATNVPPPTVVPKI